MAELLALGLLVGKRLHHADAGERVLQLGVDLGDLAAVVGKHRAHTQVLPHHDGHKHQGHHGHHAGKNGRDGKEDHVGTHDLDAADDDPLGHVVRSLADVKQVVDHAAHHVARVDAVEIAEAEALVLVKQVLAHT